jgi:hypothetical protein
VFHQEYDAVNKRDMLYKTVTGVGLEVRDINGTLLQTINTGGITFTDIEYDQNTSRLFGINSSKLTCFEQNASGGWTEQWRSTQSVSSLAQSPSGKLFCANNGNKIYVFEQNGTKSNEFGWVDGINSLSDRAYAAGFLPSGDLAVAGVYGVTGGSASLHLFSFDETGNFLKKVKICNLSNFFSNNYSNGSIYAKIHEETGLVFRKWYGHHSWGWQGKTFYNPSSVTPTYSGIEVSLWLQNGDFISGSSLYRRTFRTKMETYHNSVPQPVIHRIAQRAGTNILELDFEVIDTDDDNVTVGILAHCGSDKLVPQAWLNGTGSKIGAPIATNTVHTMEWDVKQDWPNSTGSIKFEILCQDGSRDKPVDLHFLNLPFADGNMTISRSPLKEADFVNYAKFLLATGKAQIDVNSNAVVIPAEANSTEVFTFTNCGATGRNGPTEAQILMEYNGTNLQGLVTTGWKAGYQKWTVPATGDYWIEAIGARAGNSNYLGGSGTFVRGKFSLTVGDELNIVVGQAGGDNPNRSDGAAGGGGTFVVADTNNTPLVIAGGGGGPGTSHSWFKITTGQKGVNGATELGGSNGHGGQGANGGGGGGFLSTGTANDNKGGGSYQSGLIGGITNWSGTNGGFGGGGATTHNHYNDGGGGGGYSGGAGSNSGSGGAGGSFNSGTNQDFILGMGGGHGIVRIYQADGGAPIVPKVTLLNSSWEIQGVIGRLINDLGQEYRGAFPAEVTKALEAATPGAVNNWTATNQVKPRNLPGNVNEYGFDVSTTSGLWIIKE